MDNALTGLEEANVAAEQGKRYFMNALRRAKNMRKNRLQHRSTNELCVFDNHVNCNQVQIFEHVLKQRKMLKRQLFRSRSSFNMRSQNNDHIVESRSNVLQNFGPQGNLGDCTSDREKIEFYIESLNQYKKVTHTQLPLLLDSIIQLVTLFRGFPSQEFLVLRSKLYNALFSIISIIKEIQDISGKETCESELIDAMPLAYNAISLVLYLVNEHTVGGEAASKQFIILAIKLLKIRTEDVSNFESNTYRIFKTRLGVFTGQISDLSIKNDKNSISVVQENHIPYIKHSKCLHFDLILLRFLSIHNIENNAMERNDGSRQFQNIFKDEFRKLGGMEIILSWMKLEIKKVTAFVPYLSDHKFKTGLNIETKNELPSQTILRMTMILKLFEGLSLSCHENREKMSQDEVLVATLTRTIFICSICISQVVASQTILSTELILVCIENAMRVLINITNGNLVAVQNVAKVIVSADFANVSRSGLGAIAYVLQLGVDGKYASKRLKDGKNSSGDGTFSIAHFDMSILALALLTNCLEHYIPSSTTINTLRITSDEIPLIEYLLNLFSKCRYFRKVQGTINDEFIILEGHLGLLFTCMIRKNLDRNEILNSLPNKPFETLHEAIALYAEFRENCGMLDSCIK